MLPCYSASTVTWLGRQINPEGGQNIKGRTLHRYRSVLWSNLAIDGVIGEKPQPGPELVSEIWGWFYSTQERNMFCSKKL